MKAIDPYLPYPEKTHREEYDKAHWSSIAAIIAAAPSIGIGGSLAVAHSVVWLLLPLVILGSLGLVADRVRRTDRQNARLRAEASHSNSSWELQRLAELLGSLREERRDTFRDLWNECVALDRSGADHREVAHFIGQATDVVHGARRAHENLDRLVKADPVGAAKHVPERFMLPDTAAAALASASQYVEAVQAVANDFQAKA